MIASYPIQTSLPILTPRHRCNHTRHVVAPGPTRAAICSSRFQVPRKKLSLDMRIYPADLRLCILDLSFLPPSTQRLRSMSNLLPMTTKSRSVVVKVATASFGVQTMGSCTLKEVLSKIGKPESFSNALSNCQNCSLPSLETV